MMTIGLTTLTFSLMLLGSHQLVYERNSTDNATTTLDVTVTRALAPLPLSTVPPAVVVSSPAPNTTTTTTTTTTELLSPVTHISPVRNYNWIVALIVLASVGILVVLGLEIYIQIKICGTPLMRDWSSLWLGHALLFGIFLSYLLMFAFIPYPCPTTCAIIRFCTGVCYAFCFSIIVVKLIVILCPNEIHGCVTVFLFLFVWLVQVVIDIQWLIHDTSEVLMAANSDGYVCRPGFSEHVKSLVYVMALIVGSFSSSIVARCTGSDVTGDAIFIGLSCGFTVAIWVVWILLGFLENDTEWHDPCLAFGLLATATFLLIFVFVPKIYRLNRLRDFTRDFAIDDVLPEAGFKPEAYFYRSELASVISGSKRSFGSTDDVSCNGNDAGYHREKTPGRERTGGFLEPVLEEDDNSLPPDLDPLALHLQYPTAASEPLPTRSGSKTSNPEGYEPRRWTQTPATTKNRTQRNIETVIVNHKVNVHDNDNSTTLDVIHHNPSNVNQTIIANLAPRANHNPKTQYNHSSRISHDAKSSNHGKVNNNKRVSYNLVNNRNPTPTVRPKQTRF